MRVFYFKEDIRNVTEMYYEVILSALKKKGCELVLLESATFKTARQIDKRSYILATSLLGFMKCWLVGHRNFIYWYQGITPEEDRMISGSQFRFKVFSWIEKLSLQTIRYKLGVSKYLFMHYENKYHIQIPLGKVFIMPCFNSEFHKESFFVEGKYDKNTFCFAGGMQVWQGFEDIVKLFVQIENKYPDAFLKVYSKDKVEAKKILDKYHVVNYLLDCVPQEEMEKVLADSKFGFIIREDNIINNVATPTKLGTYIGNGIIPVYTPTIHAYADLKGKYKYLCCADVSNLLEALEPYMTQTIDNNDIMKDYSKLFKDYFNKEKYIDKLVEYLDFKK